MDEIADAFEATDFHVGIDEVFYIGMCDRCKGQDTGDLLAGWLNKLHAHLADRGINISSLIQHETQSGKANSVSLVILTHPVMERSMRAALSELGVLSINSSPVKLLRIEDL